MRRNRGMGAQPGIVAVGSRRQRRLKPECCRRTAGAFLAFVLAAISGRAETLPDACPAPETRPQIEVLSAESPFTDERNTCDFADDRQRYEGDTCSLSAVYGREDGGREDGGQDAVYKVRLNGRPGFENRVGFRLESQSPGTDLVLVLVEACQDAESCVSHSPDFIESTGLEIEEIPPRSYKPGIYYLFVDSATSDPPGRCGPYKLSVFGVNPTPDLQASLLDSSDREVVAGELLRYTLSVSNQGTLDATGLTAVVELPEQVKLEKLDRGCDREAPDRVRCDIGALAVGDQESRSLAVRVSSAAQGTLTAILGVVANEGLPTSSRTSVQALTSVRQETDLHLEISAPDTVVAGEDLEYTFTVTNLGPSDSKGGTVLNELPPGVRFANSANPASGCTGQGRSVRCPFGALPAGEFVKRSFRAHVAPHILGQVSNSADVVASDPDPVSGNNRSTSKPTQVKTKTNLTLTVSTHPERAVAGESLEYLITVTNNGPSNSSGAKIQDFLAPKVTFQNTACVSDCCTQSNGLVSCAVGPLRRGEPRTVSFTVEVAPSRFQAIPNRARVDANETDRENNSTRIITPVDVKSALVLCNSGPREVFRGAQARYRLTVSNLGPSDWPKGPEEVTVDPSSWLTLMVPEGPCKLEGEKLRCPIGRLPVGSHQELRFVAAVGPDAVGETIRTQAAIEVKSPEGPRVVGDLQDSDCPPDADTEMGSTTAASTLLDRPDLVLPYFDVAGQADGTATLLKVQNVSEAPAVVRYDYFCADGKPFDFGQKREAEHGNRIPLCPWESRGVNLRHVRELFLAGACPATGYAWLTRRPVDGVDAIACPPPVDQGSPAPAAALGGDFLRIEPSTEWNQGSASGGLLVATDPMRVPRELCRNWSVRFSDAEAFADGTDFVFWWTEVAVAGDEMTSETAERIVLGRVYDESGDFLFGIAIVADENAFILGSLDPFKEVLEDGSLVPRDLPSSGTIEWDFPKGFVGNVSAVHRGKGFAINVPGVCRDTDAGGHQPGRDEPLVLPYFDLSDPDGETTLFAVRNEGDTQLEVEYRYVKPDGDELAFVESCPLPRRAVRRVDLRKHNSVATCTCRVGEQEVECASPGLASGYVQIQVIDAGQDPGVEEPPAPEEQLGSDDSVFLSGDYFRVNPAAGQAAGEALVDASASLSSSGLCYRWSTRLIAGNGFSTDFVFYAPGSTGADASEFTGTAYDEGGTAHPASISIIRSDVAFQVGSGDAELEPIAADVPFGSVEWELPDGRPFHVSTLFRAAGGYSVLIPGICLDPPPDS